MKNKNTGVINSTVNDEAEYFDAPFSVQKPINVHRVVRYQNSNNKCLSKFLSKLRILLILVPFIITIWILIAATISIFLNNDTSRYSVLIIVLDFFIIAFAAGVTLELYDHIKKRGDYS